jgi:hypothetical protein
VLQSCVNNWINRSPPGTLEAVLSGKISRKDPLDASLFMAMLPDALRASVLDALRLLVGDENFEKLLRVRRQGSSYVVDCRCSSAYSRRPCVFCCRTVDMAVVE